MRYEGAFRARYVAPLGLPATEEIARSISWGLMQVMGQVAREHGFDGRFLSALCDPDAGVSMGCVVLAAKLELAGRSSDEVRDETGQARLHLCLPDCGFGLHYDRIGTLCAADSKACGRARRSIASAIPTSVATMEWRCERRLRRAGDETRRAVSMIRGELAQYDDGLRVSRARNS